MVSTFASGHTLKAKVCSACRREFVPERTMQSVCGPRCAVRKAKADSKAKKTAEREHLRQRREAIKPRAKWLAECQVIVNKLVRLRDARRPCVSCDRPATWDGQWHGSHFRSVGAASAVRFNLWNVHKACSICNNHLSGNIAGYLPRLVERIGQDRVDWLNAQNQIVRYEIAYLKRFKQVMGKRLRRKEKRHAK